MSGKDDPVLKSMQVFLTDTEKIKLDLGTCPNCLKKTDITHGFDMMGPLFACEDFEYYMKCQECLTDYTAHCKVVDISHYATFKNGERIRPCLDEISRKAQSKQNEPSSENEEKTT